MEVRNKTCIITGSAQGLGKAFAKILLDHGAKVCISDLKEDTAKLTVEEFENAYGKERVCFVPCNVTNKDDFVKLFNETEMFFKVDCVDMLVNNAGIGTNFGWKKCMDVNIMGPMTGSEIAMERMKKSPKRGTIINIASMAGVITGMGEDMIGYTVSKHGVVALTRTLAVEFNSHGVSIKALCPLWADTRLPSSMRQLSAKSKDDINNSIKKWPLMSPDYVAQGFYKLVSACDNGTVMWAMPDTPFLIMPDTGHAKVLTMAFMAKIVGKVTGADLITVRQQKIFIVLFMCIVFLIVGWLF